MSALVSGFMEGLLYRGREGHLSFIGHRLAGLGTVLFLTIHIIDTGWAYFWPAGYGHAVGLYRSVPFMIGEILLVAAVLFHGVNGLKIILNDTFPDWWNKGQTRGSFWRVAGVTFVLWLPAAYLMGRSLYEHSLCGTCAPAETSLAEIEARTTAALIAIPVLYAALLGLLLVGAKIRSAAGTVRTVQAPRTLETYAWMFMRWSGALLIPLVWGHVLIQDVLVGVHAIDLDYVALRWAMAGWQVYDIALLAFAFAHGMNGLRAVAEDYIHGANAMRLVKWGIFLAWLGITLYGAVAILMGVRA